MTQQINLFNASFLKQKKIFTSATMARSLALLLLGAMAMVGYGYYQTGELEQQAKAGAVQLEKKKQMQEKVLVEFAPKKKDPALLTMIAAAEAEQRALRGVINLLEGGSLGNTSGYSQYFVALARQSMSDLWLTGVTIEGAGSQIGLRGRALEPDLVPAYIARLTGEAVLQGKAFGALKISRATVAGAGKGSDMAPFVDFDLEATGITSSAAPAAAAAPMAAAEVPKLQTTVAEAAK